VFLGQSGFVQENQVVPEGMVREASKLYTSDQQFKHWPQQQTMYMHPYLSLYIHQEGFKTSRRLVIKYVSFVKCMGPSQGLSFCTAILNDRKKSWWKVLERECPLEEEMLFLNE